MQPRLHFRLHVLVSPLPITLVRLGSHASNSCSQGHMADLMAMLPDKSALRANVDGVTPQLGSFSHRLT